MSAAAGALTLLAGALGATGLQLVVAPTSRAADRWRGPLGTAGTLALAADASHRAARLQVLRCVLDHRADGRWAVRLAPAQAAGLIGPRGLPLRAMPAPAGRVAPWMKWASAAAAGAREAGVDDAAVADDTIDLPRLLASWPHPRVLRQLFLWCDGRRVDARLVARWPGAARDPGLDPAPAAPWPWRAAGQGSTSPSGGAIESADAVQPAAPAVRGESDSAAAPGSPADVMALPPPRDALGALRQALGLYARLLAGRRPARRRLMVSIAPEFLLNEDLPPPTGPGDDPGEVEGPRPPGGQPVDAPPTEPMAADASDAPMTDGVLGPTGEVAALDAVVDDDDALAPQPGPGVSRLAGADDAADAVVRHDEWDCRQQTYLRRWTTVHERRLHGDDLAWRDELRARFPLLTQQIRRRFTRLAADALRRERRLPDGEIVDLDAAIDAAVTRRTAAGTVDERLYATRVRRERDVSVALLIDMSGSTSFQIPARPDPAAAAAAQAVVDDEAPFFWQVDHKLSALERGPRRRVIDVVKDAAGLLCEALSALGDRHAVWAFSGEGRDRVDFARVKDFDAPWGPTTAAALAAVEPQGSTRTGAAVRHALRRLRREPARRRVLIVLSDGYPQDRDYGPDPDDPEYGLQDTAHALREAERAGVATFNLSVDAGAHDYLRRMCPRNRYWVVDEVDELPGRMLDLYRLMAV